MSESNSQEQSPEIMTPIDLPDEEIDENFRIHTEIDILFILRGIMQKNSLITLYFDSGNNSFILTSILAIDTDKKEIVIDYGTNNEYSQNIPQSKQLTFVTSQNRVKIEFTCEKAREIVHEGKRAFAVSLPESLIRMQRRNFFRISTPITKPLKCVIPIQSDEKTTHAEITLLDISCGGIGVIDHHPIISFDPDTIYKNCQITLPEIGTITTSIQVKNTYEVTLRGGLACKRAGCEFLHLPAKMEAMIQRYIVKQEQNRKSK